MKNQWKAQLVCNFCHVSLFALTIIFSLSERAFGNKVLPYSSSVLTISNSSQPSVNVNAVSDLADIQPSDWAFHALKSLIDRYDVTGYAHATFSGDRSMTRYEFAASLAATIYQINQPIDTEKSNSVSREDLETIKRLQAEFVYELGIIQGRLDNLQTRVSTIQSFSTTTKLEGEVLFALTGVSNGDKADDSGDAIDNNLTFGSRARLTFDTSFTGKDRLRTRLQTTNLPKIDDATGTDMARLAFQGNDDNEVGLSVLEYRFPVGEQALVYLIAEGGDLDDFFATTLNSFFSGSGDGSISRFTQRNPVSRQGGGAGVGVVYDITDSWGLSLGYVTDDVDEPETGFGKAAYGAIAQLSLEPNDDVGFAITYVHSYNSLDTGTGSRRANDPFNDESDAISADSFGLETAIVFNPKLYLTGWVGFTRATAKDLPNHPTASIFNWALTLALVDLGQEGSVGGIAIGQPPKVTSNDFEVAGQTYEDRDTSVHLEAFWRFQANENLAITPGVLVITNPEYERDNSTIVVGTIRTTLSF
ncbi:MAG: iron uptake porin [Fischerella sp.]|jgi:hypothetical protein|uniref:iron uptake porin n=1 Tax=Fischerella sp. TaxID=1191 RepID=UPI0017BA0C53|nr:iron uptake porin [Fischerella sp.]NWF61632.1 iron uptake porin [Fischerella sp.]